MSQERLDASWSAWLDELTLAEVSRRGVLYGILGSAVWLSLCGEPHPLPPAFMRDTVTLLPDVGKFEASSVAAERLDRGYIAQLLQELAHEKGKAESRLEAVKDSLRLVKGIVNDQTGSAFQIDESGIYLTAKHVVCDSNHPNSPTQNPLEVINPYTGETGLAISFLLHPRADIALVHTHNGRARKPAAGLQLNFNTPHQNEELLMVSLFPGKDGRVRRMTELGSADHSAVFPATLGGAKNTLPMESAAQLLVRDMIPIGGTSGGPIINSEAAVVGVESGFLAAAQNTAHYIGARITPLSYALALPDF